jgi:GTP-binding protein Era
MSAKDPDDVSVSGEGAAEGTRFGTVALLGRPNVGKSSILNAILGMKIAATTHKPQTTRRQLRAVKTTGDAQLVFVDTPGMHRARDNLHAFMSDEVEDAARGVDLVALVVEARARSKRGEADSLVDARDLRALEALGDLGAARKRCVLVVNKIDQLKDRRALLPVLAAWNEKHRFAALVPVSAARGDGIDELVKALGDLVPNGPHLFDADAITDASERDIAAELIREKAMLELHDELPYKIAVVIEDFDESRREDKRKPLVSISAQLLVEREAQKRIVVGKQGSRIKAIGQRARVDLEHLLDAKVFLELFVKVEKDWSATARGLRRAGYRR